jgi:hypothetical protein
MKKSDLRHGMVVKTRNKLRFLVFDDKLLGQHENIRIKEYNDDMRFGSKHQPGDITPDNFDIMKVYPTIYAFKVVDQPWLPLWERKEPPRLTSDEIAILRNIDKKYKWIARDKFDKLCIYKDEPHQTSYGWRAHQPSTKEIWASLKPFDHLFDEITSSDKKPINIKWLLMQNKEEL